MHCSNCGNKLEEGEKFCGKCGHAINGDIESNILTASKSENHTKDNVLLKEYTDEEKRVIEARNSPEGIGKFFDGADGLFYSEEWLKTNGFAVVALPYYDILVDREALYLITLPKPFGRAAGIIIGFIVFRIIGAIIGAAIGFGIDRKKHQKFRAAYIDASRGITSKEYEKHIFIKIPKDKVKNSIAMKGSRYIRFNYNNQKIVLKKNKKERERFSAFITKYVL